METCSHWSNMMGHQEVKALRECINDGTRGRPSQWNEMMHTGEKKHQWQTVETLNRAGDNDSSDHNMIICRMIWRIKWVKMLQHAFTVYCYQMISATYGMCAWRRWRAAFFYKNILPPTPLLHRGGGYATTLQVRMGSDKENLLV